MGQEEGRSRRPNEPAAGRWTFGKLNLLAAILGLLAFCAVYVTGLLDLGFALLLLGLPAVAVVTSAWRAARGGLEYGLLRTPLRRELRPTCCSR